LTLSETYDDNADNNEKLVEYIAKLSIEDKKLINDQPLEVEELLLLDGDDFGRLTDKLLPDLDEQQQERRVAIIRRISALQSWERVYEEGRKHPHNYKFGNGNGNASKQNEKTQIPIFKYSARFRKSLHEAILLNDEPVFLTWSEGNRHLNSSKQIEETNRVLRPPSIEEYPYEPIEFSSLEEIKDYEGIAQNETVDSLYQKIKDKVSLYIDQDKEIIILMSGDILWTYFQDLYPTTHYYDIAGRGNGIGKSSIGFVFEGIAYRCVRMTDPSAANLYRILGKEEPGQCILVADEADRIHHDRDMLAIQKEGYSINGKVSKINPNSLKQEFFYCYCLKIRIAEESLRDNITKGVIDRSFLIKATKGRPTYDIKEVLQPANRNQKFEKLHNDLRALRKLLLVYRLIHFNDPIPDISTGLEGRDKELCKPLLQLFHNAEAYEEIRSTSQSFLDEKNKRKKSTSIEPVIYGIVVDLVSKEGNQLYLNRIWQAIMDGIPGKPDEKKPNDYHTQDYATIYRNAISKLICDNFGADREHRKDGSFLTFDQNRLVKAGRVFDIEVNTQIKPQYGKGDDSDGNDGTPETPNSSKQDGNIKNTEKSPENHGISSDNIQYPPDFIIQNNNKRSQVPQEPSEPSCRHEQQQRCQIIYDAQPLNASSFVKWAGGKRQLLPRIDELIPVSFSRYFEPFLGGGSVFFSLTRKGIKFDVYLSDINDELINAYKVVESRVEELIKVLKVYKLKYQQNPESFYYQLRDSPEYSVSGDCIKKAARFITLNRTCFNGLYRKNKQDKFNVPWGRYKNPTICNSANLSKASLSLRQSGAKISACDYKDSLLEARKDDFIYLDPPYNPTSETASFTGYTRYGFTAKNQEELANTFKKLDKKGCMVLLSNSNTPFIRKLYSDYANNTIEIDALRSINSNATKRSGHKELLIRNYSL
jgi:DNA adenine methylase Dam